MAEFNSQDELVKKNKMNKAKELSTKGNCSTPKATRQKYLLSPNIIQSNNWPVYSIDSVIPIS